MIAASVVTLSTPAFAEPKFDTNRDMGPCATAPYFGKNCVTVSFQSEVAKVGKTKTILNEQLQGFVAFAKEKKLGPILLQYSSFEMNLSYYYGASNPSYRLNGKATYLLATPQHAIAFVDALKKEHYQADILADLMKGYQCGNSNYQPQ